MKKIDKVIPQVTSTVSSKPIIIKLHVNLSRAHFNQILEQTLQIKELTDDRGF